MCLRPLYLKSNAKTLSVVSNAKGFSVPCGDCDSCVYDYGDQWTLRVLYEVRDCLRMNGDVVFITLTYDNYHLPYFHPCGKSVCCFSYDHIKVFMRELRRTLGNSDDLRFFITGEYGDKTLRSHYHGLLFFPPSLSILVQRMFPRCSKTQAFKNFIQEHWPYGLCRWSKAESKGGPGIFVKSSSAGVYVSKYVSKCVSFRSDVKDIFFRQFGVDFKKPYSYFRKKYYRNFCRHFQSRYFGDGLLADIDIDKHPDLLVSSPLPSFKDGKTKYYPVSRYQFRKLTHDFDRESKTWQLNDYGHYVKKLRLKSLADSLYLKFQRVCQPLTYASLCGVDFVANRDSSQEYVNSLSSKGLSVSRETFDRLFYYDYISRYNIKPSGYRFLFPEHPNISTLLDFLDYSYYNPVYRFADIDMFDDDDVICNASWHNISRDFLVYVDLFSKFVSLNSKITQRNVDSRIYRDVQYKKYRDYMFNLN